MRKSLSRSDVFDQIEPSESPVVTSTPVSHMYTKANEKSIIRPTLVVRKPSTERRLSDPAANVRELSQSSHLLSPPSEVEYRSSARNSISRSSLALLLNMQTIPSRNRLQLMEQYACKPDGTRRHLQIEVAVKMHQPEKGLDRNFFLYEDILVITKKKAADKYHWKEHHETARLWMSSDFANRYFIPVAKKGVHSLSSSKCLYLGWPMTMWLVEFQTEKDCQKFEKYSLNNLNQVYSKIPNIVIPISWKNCCAIEQDVAKFECAANHTVADLKQNFLRFPQDDDLSVRVCVDEEPKPHPLYGPENIFAILLHYSFPGDHEESPTSRRNSTHSTLQSTSWSFNLLQERLLALADVYNGRSHSLLLLPTVSFEAFKSRPDSKEIFTSDNSINTADTISDMSDHRNSTSGLSYKGSAKNSPRSARKEHKLVKNKKSSEKKSASGLYSKSETDLTSNGSHKSLKDLYPNGKIPDSIFSLCAKLYCLRHETQTQGVFRISSSKQDIDHLLKDLTQTENAVNLEPFSVITVACALKSFLRDLPEGLLANHFDYTKALFVEPDETANLKKAINVIAGLPEVNRRLTCLLLAVLWHLHLTHEIHRMDSVALSFILGPTFGYSVELMKDRDVSNNIVKSVEFLILHAPRIVDAVAEHFNDPEKDPNMETLVRQLEDFKERSDTPSSLWGPPRPKSLTEESSLLTLAQSASVDSSDEIFHDSSRDVPDAHKTIRQTEPPPIASLPRPFKFGMTYPEVAVKPTFNRTSRLLMEKDVQREFNTTSNNTVSEIAHQPNSGVAPPRIPPRMKRGQASSTSSSPIKSSDSQVSVLSQSAGLPQRQREGGGVKNGGSVDHLVDNFPQPVPRLTRPLVGLNENTVTTRTAALSRYSRNLLQEERAQIHSSYLPTASDTDSVLSDSLSSPPLSSNAVLKGSTSSDRIAFKMPHQGPYALLPTKLKRDAYAQQRNDPGTTGTLTDANNPVEPPHRIAADVSRDVQNTSRTHSQEITNVRPPPPLRIKMPPTTSSSTGVLNEPPIPRARRDRSNPFGSQPSIPNNGISALIPPPVPKKDPRLGSNSHIDSSGANLSRSGTITAGNSSNGKHASFLMQQSLSSSTNSLSRTTRRPKSFTEVDRLINSPRRQPQVPPRPHNRLRRRSTDTGSHSKSQQILKDELKVAHHNFV